MAYQGQPLRTMSGRTYLRALTRKCSRQKLSSRSGLFPCGLHVAELWRCGSWIYNIAVIKENDIMDLVFWSRGLLRCYTLEVRLREPSGQYDYYSLHLPLLILKASYSPGGKPLVITRHTRRTRRVSGTDTTQKIQKLCDIRIVTGSKLKNWFPNIV